MELANSEKHSPESQSNGWSALLLLGSLSAFSFSGCSSTPSSSANSASTVATSRELSDHIALSESVFAWGTNMTLSNSDGALGKIDQRHFTWGTSFEYRDAEGQLVATAKKSVFSWGVHIEIFDNEGQKLGSIQEKVLESMFSFSSHYEVLDKDDNVVAKSKKSDFFGTSVEIRNPEGALEAVFSRSSYTLLADSWTADFSGDLDRRLLIFIPSYKSQADHARTESSSSSSSKGGKR